LGMGFFHFKDVSEETVIFVAPAFVLYLPFDIKRYVISCSILGSL